MKSKTSFFEPGIFKNLLKRFWPLWTAYLVMMLFWLPVTIGTADIRELETYSLCGLDRLILNRACDFTLLAFLAGGISAMAVFSHLYNSRSCSMMASLPVKRESMFITAYLAGLLPLLAANCIAAGMAMLLGLGNLYIHAGTVLKWLGLVCLNVFSFYSAAAFCAMLTGNILVCLPVYGILELTAFALQISIDYLLQILSYGYAVDYDGPSAFSPLAYLMDKLRAFTDYTWVSAGSANPEEMWYVESSVTVQGVKMLLVYAALGVVLTIAALLLYRNRSMEAAGDTVAIPVLKPAFRYCMSIGCALVIPIVLERMFLVNRMSGPAAAAFVIGCGIVCAAAGWYAADMVIQRSFRVFPGRPLGLAAVCAMFVCLCLCAEFDAFGLERKIPEPGQVESVSINSPYATHGATVLESPEGLAAVQELHRSLIAAKSTEDDPDGMYLSLDYEMKDGSTLGRLYKITDTAVHQQALAIFNSPESILSRFPTDSWIGADTLGDCEINYRLIDPETGFEQWKNLRLEGEQGWELYSEGCLKDAAAGNICRTSLEGYSSSEYAGMDIYFYFTRNSQGGVLYVSVRVERCSEHTLKWLSENTVLDLEAILAYDSTLA